MAFIQVNFSTFNTNLTPNANGEQYLDENEAKAAQTRGAKWVKTGQTEAQYNAAYSEYQEQATAKFKAQLDSLFNDTTQKPTIMIPTIIQQTPVQPNPVLERLRQLQEQPQQPQVQQKPSKTTKPQSSQSDATDRLRDMFKDAPHISGRTWIM